MFNICAQIYTFSSFKLQDFRLGKVPEANKKKTSKVYSMKCYTIKTSIHFNSKKKVGSGKIK